MRPVIRPGPPLVHGWEDWRLPQRELEGCFRRARLGSGLSVTFSDCFWVGRDYQANLQHDANIVSLVFGQAGISSFSVESEQQAALVRPGDVWMFNLNRRVTLQRTSAADQSCRMAVIHIERHRLEDRRVTDETKVAMQRLAKDVNASASLAFLNTNPLNSLSARLMAEGQTLELLSYWFSVTEPDVQLGPDCPISVRRTVAFLLSDLSRTPAMAELTALTGISHPYLTALFRRHFGCSVYSWLRNVRLQRAAYWLAKSDRHITTIALDLGFSHGSHLSRCFVARFGCTPGKYRVEHRG